IDNNLLTYDHDGSETTSDSFDFTVIDGAGGNINSQTFDITVNPVNDAPVANNDAATTNQNQAVTVALTDLLANDSDIEGDTLSIISVENATNGSVALNGNNIIFTPDNDFSGEASFEYTLSDGTETDNAIVSITVNPLSSTEILGTPGRDMLTGDSADNIIKGFQGRDMLTGNGGADQFVYTSIRDAGDIITDFEIGSDQIVLTELLNSLGYTGSDAIGDGYVSFGSSRGNAFVQIDQDGTGSDFISRPLVLLQGVTEQNLSDNAQNSFVF
ncbi:MAG: tandem-95 repeat protein, partial [Cyanobacteria bacterium J06649_11]